jgi:uncharacterized membrane protein
MTSTVAMPMGVLLAELTTRPRISPLFVAVVSAVAGVVCAVTGQTAPRTVNVASATDRVSLVKRPLV